MKKAFGIAKRIYGAFGWLINAIVIFILENDPTDITPGKYNGQILGSFLLGLVMWLIIVALYQIRIWMCFVNLGKWIAKGKSE